MKNVVLHYSLAKVRMFFRSLWNLIVDYVRECSS